LRSYYQLWPGSTADVLQNNVRVIVIKC
jgi:hypothetical protein